MEHVEGAEGTEESVKMAGELAQESWIGWEDYCVLKGVEGLMRNKEVAMLDDAAGPAFLHRRFVNGKGRCEGSAVAGSGVKEEVKWRKE